MKTLAMPTPRAASDDYLRNIISEVEGELAATPPLSRRSFLKLSGLAGGGLVLAFCFGARSRADAAPNGTDGGDGAFAPNAFVKISPDGSILIYSKGPEIGQGIKTAFPLIIAEELDAKWSDVVVEQAPVDPATFGRQSAGGSRSIPASWDQLRQVGAVGRAMLVAAAAEAWSVPAAECRTADSMVTHPASKRHLSYGELANRAAKLPVPAMDAVKLKSRADYRLIGKWYTGVDNRQVVTGAPLFGLDQVVPGMLFAVYQKCPATGGKVRSANLDQIKALPGVRYAFAIAGNDRPTEVMPGVAIVADSTWAAFQAQKQLRVEWDESEASKDSWSGFVAKAKELSTKAGAEIITDTGDVDAALKSAAKTVESFYTYPFVSHAPLEPQNGTAWHHDGILEVWAPTQTADGAIKTVANVVGLSPDKVTIHQTRVGGGFGRRLMNDYLCEAGAIAMQVDAPVKLIWTREEDMAHDFFRVGGFHALKGGVDAAGKLSAWQSHFITFSSDGKQTVSGGNLPGNEFPALQVANFRQTQSLLPLITPCGPWRAPRSNSVAWVIQSFIHELAVAANRDHVEFLLEIMGEPRQLERSLHTGRAAGVIKLAAEKAGWGKKLPAGHGLGMAFHFSHSGHFAEVAEVSVDANKKLKVHRVVVAGDIGPVINMSGANNQCEGGVVDGFSTMLGLEITMENGRMQQSNFHQYPLLRMPDHPTIEVHFIQTNDEPTGVGEPALPPVAPAICNAIFAACGHRVRTLPLVKEGFSV